MRYLLTIAMSVFFAGQCRAQTADEIAAKASEVAYYQGQDGSARAVMTVTDSAGRIRLREITIIKLNEAVNAGQKYYVYFHKPNDVAGMSYIVWKHIDTDDDRWLYLPALDLVRRVAASDKRSSFAGTNFLYEDISGRSINADTHELIAEDAETWHIKNTPKDAGVEFLYYTIIVDKATYVPRKAEYYDKQGKVYRTIEALETADIQGLMTITKMKATDHSARSSTITEFSRIRYNIGVDSAIFTERYLRKAPPQVEL